MKISRNVSNALILAAASILFTFCFSGESSSAGSGTGSTEVAPVNPGTMPTAKVEITGALTKSLTVPLVNMNYNGEYDLWIGNDPEFEIRFKWSGTPEAGTSYGSGIDQKVLVCSGDRRWEYWISYTVKLNSTKPASGTVTGTVQEQDAYCCDSTKGESNPINVSVTFSGL